MGCGKSKSSSKNQGGVNVTSSGKAAAKPGNDSEYDYKVKVLVVGDLGVGKTSIVNRFCENTFSETPDISAGGADFKARITTAGGEKLQVQMVRRWSRTIQNNHLYVYQSTSAHIHFQLCLTYAFVPSASYYRGANLVLIIFDISNQESFDSLQRWLSEVERYAGDDVKKLVLGNKSDLADHRMVNANDAKALAERLGTEYFEVSAKVSANLDQAMNAGLTDAVKLLKGIPL